MRRKRDVSLSIVWESVTVTAPVTALSVTVAPLAVTHAALPVFVAMAGQLLPVPSALEVHQQIAQRRTRARQGKRPGSPAHRRRRLRGGNLRARRVGLLLSLCNQGVARNFGNDVLGDEQVD